MSLELSNEPISPADWGMRWRWDVEPHPFLPLTPPTQLLVTEDWISLHRKHGFLR